MYTIMVRLGLLLALIVLLPAAAHAQYGPTIRLWSDGNDFVKATLRDSETVAVENLGIYLTRVTFKSTEKVIIQGGKTNPDRATLHGKFDLELADGPAPKGKAILKIAVTELQLVRSKSNRAEWFLTNDGITAIEKIAAERKK